MSRSAFMIAATSSGCGKTTLSLGLMRLLRRRGAGVQPFKCGPDYIDTRYHAAATGVESINLDLYMSTGEHVRSLFDQGSSGSEVSIVEGVMGMFDGYDRMRGSSAELALTLDIPVVLLVNAASTAYSVAATIYGFTRMDPHVRVAGVIFNRVASENHYRFLSAACRDAGVPALGYLRRNEGLRTPSRHLGLSLESEGEMERFIEMAADEVGANVDVAELLALTRMEPRAVSGNRVTPYPAERRALRVAVADDEAFNFMYPANIRAFGCRTVRFSPLRDRELPEADMLYLPGGYPELYARELEMNTEMRRAVREYAMAGGRILAECGGMIYLTRDIDGREMCGVLALSATMEGARLSLGYRRVCLPGLELRGHEFHYSHIIDHGAGASVARQYNARGEEVATPLYRYRNVFAGYTHLYWGESDIFKLWEI